LHIVCLLFLRTHPYMVSDYSWLVSVIALACCLVTVPVTHPYMVSDYSWLVSLDYLITPASFCYTLLYCVRFRVDNDNRYASFKKRLKMILFFTKNDAIIAIFTRNNCEAIIYMSKFKLESWKTVPSTALYPLYIFTCIPSTALCPLNGPLSLLRPSAPSTALYPPSGHVHW
jgi:hypothetical protein